MTNKDWRFTPHARYESWEERFSEYDIKDAINRSVLWGGGQRHDDSLYYDSVSGAVFVVTHDGWVKTVLTLDMAIANMQSRNGFACKLDFNKPRVVLPKIVPNRQNITDDYYDTVDARCFDCAKYIYDNYTKEAFEYDTKSMCEFTKAALKKFELRKKQYGFEWSQVNKYLYQLWKGEIKTYNDVVKKQLAMV